MPGGLLVSGEDNLCYDPGGISDKKLSESGRVADLEEKVPYMI